MHRRNALSMITTIAMVVLITFAMEALVPKATFAQCTCTAGSLFGGRCTVTCPVGFTCDCSGGIFSADCRCIPLPTPTPYPPRQFNLGPVSEAQLRCAERLQAYLEEQGVDSEIGAAIGEVIAAVRGGNADAYTVAENHYVDSYADAPEDVRAYIQAWLDAHPECANVGS